MAEIDSTAARQSGWLSGAIVAGFLSTMLAAVMVFGGYVAASVLATLPGGFGMLVAFDWTLGGARTASGWAAMVGAIGGATIGAFVGSYAGLGRTARS